MRRSQAHRDVLDAIEIAAETARSSHLYGLHQKLQMVLRTEKQAPPARKKRLVVELQVVES